MTQDEFEQLHGKEAWDRLVRPRQVTENYGSVVARNANVIVHQDIIGPVLSLLGFEENSLIDAREELHRLRANG